MTNRHPLLPSQINPDARLRLVGLPYAGGGVAVFHRWRQFIPPEIELVPLRLPGREDRFHDPAYLDLLKLASDACDAIKEINDRPIALLGYSMGSYVALEIAREMRRRKMPEPVLLVVAASPAPYLAKSRPRICHLPDDEFLTEIVERYDGVPEVVRTHQELLNLLLPTLRADFYMLEGYFPPQELPLDVVIFALGGAEDRGVTITDLQAWQKYTTARCSARLFPGGHFFLFRDQEESSGAVAPNPIGLQMVVNRLQKVLAKQ